MQGTRENWRFHFNSMDTLPYWYEPAPRVFAEMDAKEFLDATERWIVDNWKITNNPWMWTDEPRNSKITDRMSLLAYNDHGARPVIERFHTYLEWHAMWCAVGELIQTHPLAKLEDDSLDNFEDWLSDDGLSLPPWWLADFHGPKPSKTKFGPNQLLPFTSGWMPLEMNNSSSNWDYKATKIFLL